MDQKRVPQHRAKRLVASAYLPHSLDMHHTVFMKCVGISIPAIIGAYIIDGLNIPRKNSKHRQNIFHSSRCTPAQICNMYKTLASDHSVRLKVFTAVNTKKTVFWITTQMSEVLAASIIRTSETLVNYRTTRRYNPKTAIFRLLCTRKDKYNFLKSGMFRRMS